MFSLSLENTLESDLQIDGTHEGRSVEDYEPEPESKESGNDYFEDLSDNADEEDSNDGKIVVVTEESQDTEDYIQHYGRSDPDPPSFDGMELANDNTATDDNPFASLNVGEKGKDYQDWDWIRVM